MIIFLGRGQKTQLGPKYVYILKNYFETESHLIYKSMVSYVDIIGLCHSVAILSDI